MHHLLLPRRGTSRGAARTIEADAANTNIADYGAVNVDIAHYRPVYVHHRGVIAEDIPAPHASDETLSAVAEAIINAAVVADLGAPVAVVPAIGSVVIAPVPWRPQVADLRWFDPDTRNPVIAVILGPGPVARRPQVAVLRAGRLLVDHQRGRGRMDRNTHPKTNLRRQSGRREAKQDRWNQRPEF